MFGKIRLLRLWVQFAYPNAKVSAIGNDYVRKGELETVIESRSLAEAVNLVNSRTFPLKDLKSLPEIERTLDNININAQQSMITDAPSCLKPFLKTYLKKYEGGAIKSVLRRILLNAPRTEIEHTLYPVGALTPEIIATLLEIDSTEDVIETLESVVIPSDVTKGLTAAISEFESDLNFQKIETILDRYVFDELHSIKQNIDPLIAAPIVTFIGYLTDIANLKILLRAKRQEYSEELCRSVLLPPGRLLPTWKLDQMCDAISVEELINDLEGTPYHTWLKKVSVEYEKEKDITPFEIALDKFMLQAVVDLSHQNTITAGPMLRYLVAEEFEIRNLKTIFHGVSESLQSGQITALLVTEDST